jgi:hypothetical protein
MAAGVVRGADLVRQRAEQRLRVGAREVPELLRQPRQRAGVLHGVQQALCAECAGAEHDVPRGERPPVGPLPAGAMRPDLVATVRQGADGGGRSERVHLGARTLREVQVVLDQGVLGAVAAAGHALAALAAARAFRSGTPEERVRRAPSGRGRLGATGPEVHADTGRAERMAHTHVLRDLADDLVGRGPAVVPDHAEHALRLVVVRCELGLPVGDVRPGRVCVERVQGAVQRVGVHQ